MGIDNLHVVKENNEILRWTLAGSEHDSITKWRCTYINMQRDFSEERKNGVVDVVRVELKEVQQ